METPTTTLEAIATIKNPEGKENFAEMVHAAMYRFAMEQPNIRNFRFGGREYDVDSPAAGIKAIGQLGTHISLDVYNQVLKKTLH